MSSKVTAEASTASKSKNSATQFFSASESAIQMKLAVGPAGDKFEREADRMADKVLRMPEPKSPANSGEHVRRQDADTLRKSPGVEQRLQKSALPTSQLQRATPINERQPTDKPRTQPAALQRQLQPAIGKDEKLQRKATREATPAVDADLQTAIQSQAGGGQALPADLKLFMESRFQADFSQVRIHHNRDAAAISNRLSARAFTYRNHIFFGEGQYQPGSSEGKQLLAHELTHTIQQGQSVQRSPQVAATTTAPRIQRLGLSDILDALADLAANLPGFTLLTLILGRNPINLRLVERTLVNLLRGFMGLIPGGEILYQVLQRYGVVERLGAWVESQVTTLGLNFQAVRDAFNRFTDSLGWRDIFRPGDVWNRARNIFSGLVERIRSFVSRLISQAITWLKQTFMQPLAEFCQQIPGYGLVKVMLGRDPFTNVSVPRTAMTVVRAFAEFIPGGTEKVDQLQQSGALQRAYDWFVQETQIRNLTWARVSGIFAQAWDMLRLENVLQPIATLRNMLGLFRPLLSDLVGFAGAALLKLLELIYEAAMGAGGRRILAILTRARATFVSIIRNPVGFLGNLLSAVGQGVRHFMTNILVHLRDGVIAWLAGPVARAGIQVPTHWDLPGIIGFVLQILGLTWTRVREKLVRLLGERPVAMLESGFQLIQDIRQRGLAVALRERVGEFFGNLREAALGSIRNFIQQRLVMAGITQLLSMLNPVGAVIQAIVKTYTTVQFFIQRINQILDLVESVVNSISSIAAGAIAAAANFIERTMARTIPVILDFLARFIGLGDVGGQVQRTIQGLQGRVDQMLDRVVEWIRNQARNLASRALGGDPNASPQQRLQNGLHEGALAVNRLPGNRIGLAVIRPVLAAIRIRNTMQRLDAEPRGNRWIVTGTVNPSGEVSTNKLASSLYYPQGTATDPVLINWYKKVEDYPQIFGRTPTQGFTRTLRDAANRRMIIRKRVNASNFPGSAARLTRSNGDERQSVHFFTEAQVAAIWRNPRNNNGANTPRAEGGNLQLPASTIRGCVQQLGRPSTNVFQIDHVRDLQAGGPDALNNLWPIQAARNSSFGTQIQSMRIVTSRLGPNSFEERSLSEINGRWVKAHSNSAEEAGSHSRNLLNLAARLNSNPDSAPIDGTQRRPYLIGWPKSSSSYPTFTPADGTQTVSIGRQITIGNYHLQVNSQYLDPIGGAPWRVSASSSRSTADAVRNALRSQYFDANGQFQTGSSPRVTQTNDDGTTSDLGMLDLRTFLEADHVKDLNYGGSNHDTNIWPLQASKNNAANAVNYQFVAIKENNTDQVKSLRSVQQTPLNVRIVQVSGIPSGSGAHGTSQENPAGKTELEAQAQSRRG